MARRSLAPAVALGCCGSEYGPRPTPARARHLALAARRLAWRSRAASCSRYRAIPFRTVPQDPGRSDGVGCCDDWCG